MDQTQAQVHRQLIGPFQISNVRTAENKGCCELATSAGLPARRYYKPVCDALSVRRQSYLSQQFYAGWLPKSKPLGAYQVSSLSRIKNRN